MSLGMSAASSEHGEEGPGMAAGQNKGWLHRMRGIMMRGARHSSQLSADPSPAEAPASPGMPSFRQPSPPTISPSPVSPEEAHKPLPRQRLSADFGPPQPAAAARRVGWLSRVRDIVLSRDSQEAEDAGAGEVASPAPVPVLSPHLGPRPYLAAMVVPPPEYLSGLKRSRDDEEGDDDNDNGQDAVGAVAVGQRIFRRVRRKFDNLSR